MSSMGLTGFRLASACGSPRLRQRSHGPPADGRQTRPALRRPLHNAAVMYRYDGVDQSTPECLEPRWCTLPHRQRPDTNSPPHRPRELPLTSPLAEVSATISPSGPIVGTGDRLKSASDPRADIYALVHSVVPH